MQTKCVIVTQHRIFAEKILIEFRIVEDLCMVRGSCFLLK